MIENITNSFAKKRNASKINLNWIFLFMAASLLKFYFGNSGYYYLSRGLYDFSRSVFVDLIDYLAVGIMSYAVIMFFVETLKKTKII